VSRNTVVATPDHGDCCRITILNLLDTLNYEERGFCVFRIIRLSCLNSTALH